MTLHSLVTGASELGSAAGVAFVALSAVSLPVSGALQRRWLAGRPRFAVFGACVSLALIVSVTLLRGLSALVVGVVAGGEPAGAGLPGSPFDWSADGWSRLTYDGLSSTQNLLNLLLFVPAGLFVYLLVKRPFPVIAGLVGLSLTIELMQAITKIGAADVADLATNSAGAVLGVLGGVLTSWLVPHVVGNPRPTRQRMVTAAAAVTVVIGVLVAGTFTAAHARQQALERRLLHRFDGTSLAYIEAWARADNANVEFFTVDGVRIDGVRYADRATVVRYPASFLGVRRCVFVEWRPSGVRIRPGTGARCSQLLG